MKKLFAVAFVFVFAFSSFGATWRGKNIDNIKFDAEIYSYGTSRFYSVIVKFIGDQCVIYWKNGGYVIVDLDDEEIDDIHNISAYHYKTSTFYDIDVEGLD